LRRISAASASRREDIGLLFYRPILSELHEWERSRGYDLSTLKLVFPVQSALSVRAFELPMVCERSMIREEAVNTSAL
jgi:hypothetical protein